MAILTAFTVILFAVALVGAPGMASAKRPNFVVIQTDDQTAATLHETFTNKRGKRFKVMPNTERLLGNKGIQFTNYYSSIPVCSPSRATLLSGQYAHTSGLSRNSGKRGGARGFSESPLFEQNLATALRDRGYHTAHFGRFTNNYGKPTGYDEKAVPPGWDSWATDWTKDKVRRFYGYSLNVNGSIEGPFGKARYGKYRYKDPVGCPSTKGKIVCNYHTDQISSRAIREIKKADPGPIYVQVDYEAPHDGPAGTTDTEPARRHIGSANRVQLPEPPGFNEKNIRDKPKVLRAGNTRLTKDEIRGIEVRYRRQLESMRAVDDGIGRIVKMLKKTKRLSKTYIFFLSDNGYFLGEHRFGKSKFLPHEPSSNTPLIVRGPKADKNKISNAIVGNVDLAPTIVDLAGAELGLEPDGRSFASVLKNPKKVGRRSMILESYMLPSPALQKHLFEQGKADAEEPAGGATISGKVPYVNYTALRAGRYKYVKYEGGGRELYDLKADPYELSNKVKSGRYARVVRRMDNELERRRFCAGDECRKGVRKLPRPKPKPEREKPGKKGGDDRP
ncbi:MAG TPA: sulfatase [Solirubrobacterales bacterium]|nr:sulfatase [Solirubrobacterales bacterium]